MSQKLRIIIPLALLGVAGVAYATHVSAGTLSAFGWESISLICPIGALGTMLASKMLVPRAVISVVLAVAAILLLGRAFCGWLCPIPVWSKLRGIFKKQEPTGKNSSAAESHETETASDSSNAVATGNATATVKAAVPLSAAEKRALKTSCTGGCSSCADRKPADSRHIILGGTLLSAAIFGFPVFCLICPVGLSVATFIALWRLLQFSEATLSLVVFPVILVAEIVLLRKWCHRFCPLGALLGLMARLNRTFRPTVAAESCLHCSGASCSRCADVCPEGIDLHHPEASVSLAECTKCGECRDACPAHAISFPLLARTEKAGLPVASAAQEADEDAVGAEG